ncbi:TonB family protein [Patescibacteria group bacterium]|nr:TonB family protein [Patescibacteria group bacterium]
MLNDKAIRTTFIISLAGHCFLLGMPGFNLPVLQDKKPEEITVRVEIEKSPLLPKIDVMGEEKKLKEVVEKPKPPEPEPEPEFQPEEVMIEELPKEPIKEKIEVVDSTKEAMFRYQDMVKQRIEEVRRYPYLAKRQGIEGIAYLSFSVLSNGLSQDIKIVRSSGFPILDKEALATIKRVNPFPPIPEEINMTSVQMEVSIVFTLQ